MKRWQCEAASVLIAVLLASPLAGCGLILPKYTASVERVAANDFERGLIAAAEAACADQAALAATCTEGTDSSEECGWSCGQVEYFKVAYAVTQEALDYYQGLINKYNDFGVPPWEKPHSANLRYKASVSFDNRYTIPDGALFENVYLVDLDISFSAICGPICGDLMGAGRRVVFDAAGNLLAIEGDRQRFTLPY